MRNITKTALALVVSLTAGYGVYTSQQKSELSELALANIEALAGNEWDGDNECHMDITFWECLKYTEGVGCYCGL